MKSMTGFGSGEAVYEDESFSVEIKTINHRYRDFNIKSGRRLSPLEDKLRKSVSDVITRGHIDISIRYTATGTKSTVLTYDKDLARAYKAIIDEAVSEIDGLDGKLNVIDFIRLPNVISTEDPKNDIEELWSKFYPALKNALDMLDKNRLAEGEVIQKDFTERLAFLKQHIDEITALSDSIPKAYYEALKKNVSDYTGGVIDEDRLATELAVYADRVNVTEEIVRFNAHIEAFKKTMAAGAPAGRKLDFTLQEINREANTIASKSNSFEISNIVVEIKAELEKIREQVQNIE